MQKLLRPARYAVTRPTFSSAYARAARRYGFQPGKYAGFAKRDNVVVKVKAPDSGDDGTSHEVPAESIQNGKYVRVGD
jgi:hypothetical protein